MIDRKMNRFTEKRYFGTFLPASFFPLFIRPHPEALFGYSDLHFVTVFREAFFL